MKKSKQKKGESGPPANNVPKIEVVERTIAIPKYFSHNKKDAGCQADLAGVVEKEYETRKIMPIIQERYIPIKNTIVEHIEIPLEPEEYSKMILPLFGKNGLMQLPDENLHPDDADYFADLQPTLAGWRQKFHHEPLPVELEITSYTPKLIPRLVDRAVPIPVELDVIVEYEIPIIKPRWVEKPIPIPVKANIELPIPLDVLLSKTLHEPYMDVIASAFLNQNVQEVVDTGMVDRTTAEKMIHLSNVQHMTFPIAERVDIGESLKNDFGVDCKDLEDAWSRQDSRGLKHVKGLDEKQGKAYIGTTESHDA